MKKQLDAQSPPMYKDRMSTTDTDELLTMREAAAYLKVHRHTLRSIIRAGRLPTVGVSTRTRRVRRSDLARFVKENAK